jgi:hypothetical protein
LILGLLLHNGVAAATPGPTLQLCDFIKRKRAVVCEEDTDDSTNESSTEDDAIVEEDSDSSTSFDIIYR